MEDYSNTVAFPAMCPAWITAVTVVAQDRKTEIQRMCGWVRGKRERGFQNDINFLPSREVLWLEGTVN